MRPSPDHLHSEHRTCRGCTCTVPVSLLVFMLYAETQADTAAQDITMAPIQAAGGNFNVYDIRKPCIGPLCYDFSRLDDYLAQPSVRSMLGVGDRPWQSCDPGVYADFVGEGRRPSSMPTSPTKGTMGCHIPRPCLPCAACDAGSVQMVPSPMRAASGGNMMCCNSLPVAA